MDIMDKIDDIKNYFNRNKKKKVKEEDPDAALEEESPNSPSAKGSTGLIPGIKRKWVRGGAIFLTLVFILAVIYGTDMGEDQKKNTQDLGRRSELPLNSEEDAKRASGNVDDYAALMEANKRQQAAALAARNAQQPPKNVQAEQQQMTQQQQQQQVRQQPTFSQPYTLPTQTPQQVANQYAAQQAALLQQEQERSRKEQEAAEKSEAERLQNQYQSAIAFNLGNSGMNAGSSGGGGSAPTATDGSGSVAQPVSYTGGSSASSYAPVTGVYAAAAPRTIVAGTIIPVMLLTGINTDAPGQVMCQVQSDVYDYDGVNLLIPAGSRLLGTYDSQTVSNGRVNVTFSNLQTTDGGTWSIGNSIVAIDGAGYSGISGKVHHHTGRKIGGGLIGSAIAALGSLAAGNTSSVNTYSAGQIAMQGALANLISTTSSMFQDASNVKNTVTVEPGYQFNVYVTNNISF